uniref:PPIase FKBP-type domain-containing protein n=1 Tax=Guillardia theta TaxID=55529 RepID=A0A7S4KNQ0_GUITH
MQRTSRSCCESGVQHNLRMKDRTTFTRADLVSMCGGLMLTLNLPPNAQALVKGIAPPPDFGKKKDLPTKKITNIQEAQEYGAQREATLFDKQDGNFSVTKEGDRYRDVRIGTGAEVKPGSEVEIKYRVLRLGKRSRDGLSGEASLVFSYGYGEDDDKETDTLKFVVGEANLINALSSSLPGMKQGGLRRISVKPERGWKLEDASCVKSVDIGSAVGLPGGAVTEAETCLDFFRVPSPATFQAKRKLSRRFDENLLMEVEVIKVSN